MDPSVDTLKSSLVITNTMLETLAMNTPAQTFKPWLAESWQSVAPTKWRLKLKRGVKFHNGEPFDADAVIYSVKVFRETKGLARGWFGFLAGAEKVDDYTVDLVTSPAHAPSCRRASPSSTSSRPSTTARSAPRASRRSRSGPAPGASCPGRRASSSRSSPTPTTGARSLRSARSTSAGRRRGRAGWPSWRRARCTWPRTFPPRSPSGSSARAPRVSRR